MRRAVVFFLSLFCCFCFFPEEALGVASVSVDSSKSEIKILEQFEIAVSGNNLDPNSTYFTKFRSGLSLSDMGEGETLSNDGQSWLGDNSSFDKFPTIATDNNGIFLNSILIARVKMTATLGQNYFMVRLRKLGTSTNLDSIAKTINVHESPTPISTPTAIPTNEPTLIPVPTFIQKAVYKINKAKDNSGGELSNVKIYVDDIYTHHYDNEVLTFCDSCHCDDEEVIDCGFGQHTVRLEKGGYQDWQDTRTFNSGDSDVLADPVLATIVPSSTPTLVPTLTPSSTPTKRSSLTPTKTPTSSKSLTATPSLKPEVLGENVSSKSADDSGQNMVTSSKKTTDYVPYVLIALGVIFAGVSGFLFLRTKKDLGSFK